MRIQFEQNQSQNVDKATTKYVSAPSTRIGKVSASALDISGIVMDNNTYEVQGRTAEEVMQEAGNIDVTLLHNYMTVMSHSMSEEDFAAMQRDGYCPTDMEIEEVVTIVDKIKAELIKAGVDVAGYTDTLDMDTLAQIAGSESFARSIANALKRADVPVTEQNMADAAAAVQKAEKLTSPSVGTQRYMTANHLEPTIDNFYRTEYSGADYHVSRAKGYYREEMPGYYAKQADSKNTELPAAQMEKVIIQAGLEVTEETVENARFLVEQGISLTEGNLRQLGRVKSSQVPVQREEVLHAVAGALADGKRAGEGNLYDGRSYYEKAVDMEGEIDRLLLEARESGTVTERRQLEEIRLHMTVEANVKLLKSGVSIDTSNLEQLVEALKQLEESQAQKLFGASKDPAADYTLYKETLQTTATIPYIPAAVIGNIAEAGEGETTVSAVYAQGKVLQANYERAGESYEALMTTPRKDMGDNILTAFRNVDTLLQELGLDPTESNRRAVRILGYNNMDITDTNIKVVKKADYSVQRVVRKMTPAATMQMIRDQINPLETSLEELEQYLDSSQTYDSEAMKYSRYLYNLEHNHEITQPEKQAYIGIYRMLRQIEKTDGGALGSLVNSGAQISFSNLLTAVRTGKSKEINVKVNDEFGVLEKITIQGASVTDQIAMGYTAGLTDFWSEQMKGSGDAKKLLEDVRSIPQTEDSVLELLKQYELPATADNLLALSYLSKDRSGGVRRLWETRESMDEIPSALVEIDIWEGILDSRESAYENYGAYMDELMEVAREQTFKDTETSVDVRAMQMVHKQLSVMKQAAATEEYHIPVLIDQEMTAIHLTLRHESGVKGRIVVSMDSHIYGRITAYIELDGDQVGGYMTGESKEAEDLLTQLYQPFQHALEEQSIKVDRVPVVKGKPFPSIKKKNSEEDSAETVETAQLYQVAKIFIETFKQEIKNSAQ